jgi:hypothetical protein
MLPGKLVIAAQLMLVIPGLLISCRTSQKAAIKCPEFQSNNHHKVISTYRRNKYRRIIIQQRAKGRKQPVARLIHIKCDQLYPVLEI